MEDSIKQSQPSLADLFARLAGEIKSLMNNEIRLAKIEMSHKAIFAGKNSAMLIIGVAVIYAGFLGLMATFILALGLIMHLWLASLLVTMFVLSAGATLVFIGVNKLKKIKLMPELAIGALKKERG